MLDLWCSLPEDKDVRYRCFVGRNVDGVFEDGGRCFGKARATIGVRLVYWDESGAFGLLEGLSEGRLAGSRGAAIWSDLGPSFAEKVAKLPARLDCGAKELFIRFRTFTFILSKRE